MTWNTHFFNMKIKRGLNNDVIPLEKGIKKDCVRKIKPSYLKYGNLFFNAMDLHIEI